MRGIGPITRKEKEILDMLAAYCTYEHIGITLHISISTVYYHISSIMIKTSIHKKEHLIKYAQEHGYGRKEATA